MADPALDTRILNTERFNASARLANSSIVDGDEKLIPLRNVFDGKPVEHFPSSINQLETLAQDHPEQVIDILRDLGLLINHMPVLTDSSDAPADRPPGYWDSQWSVVLQYKRLLRSAIGLAPSRIP